MIRISKIFLGLLAVCLLLLPACTELIDGVDGGIDNASAMTLSLTMDGMDLEVATRATMEGTADENKVKSLYLFFFEPSNNGTGKFVDVIEIEALSGVVPKTSDIDTKNTAVSTSEAYRVIGVANGEDYISGSWNEKSTWEEKTEADFRQQAVTNEVTTFTSGNLLMNGSAVKTEGNGLIEMKLTRNVVRVDVVMKDDPDTYELQSVQLRNVYVKSSITGDAVLNYASSNTADRKNSTEIDKGIVDRYKMEGMLYAFENKVTSPSINDKVTTCVIVKLGCTVNNQICRYFRININPEGESQNLRRNNVYSISINKINGEGYLTADEAYNGTRENELDYTINNWVDDKGLIVSDSYSILALPVKVAQIGKEGGTFFYTISTFSTLESPIPLKLETDKSKWDNDLTVSLEGNTLKVIALPLTSDDEVRNGSVTLSFAGLEATMEIEQSLKANAFLKLVYADEWSGLLPAAGGGETKNIQVFASGSWKATIIGDEGFSFNNGTRVTDMANSGTSGEFTVKTISSNLSKTSRRNAFVIVSLDADPINCVAVVSLAQTTAGTITISPLTETVVFDGSMSNLATGSNVQTFTVNISEGALSATITENSDKFAYWLDGNTLKIYTKSANNSASSVYGKLKLSGGGSELILNLVQKPLSLSVITSNPTTVDCNGGNTGSFYLSDDTQCTVSLKVNGLERNVYNHGVKLVDESGNVVSQGVTFNSQKKLQVKFDKIAFPNREIEIKATVTYTTNAGGTASYTFTQTKLSARKVNIWNLRNGYYGSLTDITYFGGYITALKNAATTYITNASVTPASGNSYSSDITYIHLGNKFSHISSFNWGPVQNFRQNADGITVLTGDEGAAGSISKMNQFLNPLGFSGLTNGAKSKFKLAGGLEGSNIGKFLTTKGKETVYSPVSASNFNGNTYNSYITNIPTTAIKVVVGDNNEIYMAIDVTQKVVYIGECEILNKTGDANDNRTKIRNNFIQYVVNAAKYGSNFTDMLLESASTTPWDDVWGDNRWPLRSN